MARFALRRYAFLSLLVAALFSGSAVRAEEDENLRKELELINKDLANLDLTIAASDRLLAQNPWATAASCAWIVAGPGRFVALTGGRQWQLDDYIRAVKASGKPEAEQQELINKARGRVTEQTKVCNDPLVRNAAQFRADRTARLARKAEIEKRLAATPPPPPGPATAWSGRWVSPIGSQFDISIQGNTFICKGEIHSYFVDELTIFSKDECEWNGKAPVKCRYSQNENLEIIWNSEGESKFELKDGVLIRTAKASGSVKVTFTQGWEDHFSKEFWTLRRRALERWSTRKSARRNFV